MDQSNGRVFGLGFFSAPRTIRILYIHSPWSDRFPPHHQHARTPLYLPRPHAVETWQQAPGWGLAGTLFRPVLRENT
jgi:hypothetical protein